MDINQFDELAGRIDGLARAVVLLAEMMERETDMDGPTLSRQWREAVPPRSGGTPAHRTARTMLQELAQSLDDARSYAQKAAHQAKLADPSLFRDPAPSERRQILHLSDRVTQTEHRLDRLDGTKPRRPGKPKAQP